MVYSIFTSIFTYNSEVKMIRIVNCFLLALILTTICIQIKRRYNRLLASVFFLVFWLSPWIIKFAPSMYWVEFLWFLPMLIGLYCLNNIDCKKQELFAILL